ncbi:MAG: winged helix-turn-helix domain-containing protein [Phycisphaerales bacterium]|nr:winged helix-turn-helix domain-containing protein [Hyphomonadaceae bacterium]
MDALFTTDGIEIRPAERRVLVHGEPAVLGGRAFDLLLTLIAHRDRVIGKDELMTLVWPGIAVEENNLTVQISALRKVLGNQAIATVAGRGYRFTLPLRSGAPAPASATPPAKSERPVIAVLAFDNLSNEPEMQFFSDGVSEEIIQRLSRGTNLKVIARTSSFQFRGDRKAEAAQQLQCDYVLDGAIQRAAGRVRISAQLMEAASRTALWSDRYDRGIEDIFAVQDEISQSIASALRQTFNSAAPLALDPSVYDLYLRSNPKSYAPDELRASVRLLEVVAERAPDFAQGWGRLAYLRGFLHVYLPFAERRESAQHVAREGTHALSLDPENVDALAGQCFVMPPFGRFIEADQYLERLQHAPGSGDGRRYIGWFLRHTGRLREALEETEREYRLDARDPMAANVLALACMASGRIAEAIPVYEDLVVRVPEMSFPISSLLRAQAFQQDWPAVNRLLALAAKRPLREFQDTIPFVRAKRDPTPENIGAWRGAFEAHIAKTGGIDIARLVYAAHLGLVEDAYRVAGAVRLGPAGTSEDIMGPDGYRTALLFQASMPELRNDKRFPRLCARLGLVEFWMASGKWPDCANETPYDFKQECSRVQDVPKEPFGF